jgi:hypothetical protein
MAQPPLEPFSPPDFVPAELRRRKQWIGWRARWDEARGKYDKLPVCIPTGRGDGYLHPGLQVGYDEAVAAIGRLNLTGIGFALTNGCGLIGGDLDNCHDPSNGEFVEHWAFEIVLQFKETYFEVSPSGRGVRFFALGELNQAITHKPAGVELYGRGRFLTFTGKHVPGTPREIAAAPKTLAVLAARVARIKAEAGPPKLGEAPVSADEVEAFKRYIYAQTPWGKVNEAALQRLQDWVPTLFPTAVFQPGTGAWRVKQEDLGHPELQEDLSIAPNGIVDWGIHDMGDPKQGKRSPIDLVLKYHPLLPENNEKAAAKWLAEELEIPFHPEPGPDPPLGLKPEPGLPDPDADLWAQWEATLERLRQASLRPNFISEGFTETEDGAAEPDFDYQGPVAIRPGITDRLTRGMVSMVSAAPNVGKSTYLSLEALAVALENSAAIGQPGIDWCGDALIVSNEESCGAILARLRGQRRTSGIDGLRLKHKLSIWPTDRTRLRLGKLDAQGAVVPTKAGIAFVEALARRAEQGRPIAFLGLDTLVSLFEGIEENSATEMDKAIGLLVAIADAGFMAIDVMHHTGKAGPTETIISYRGSSAIFAAVAEMSTFVSLPQEEVEWLKMPPGQGKRTLRMTGQRQRDGIIPGVWHFEREVVSLAAQDPREPEALKIRTVATLRAIPTPTPPIPELDEAQHALWEEQQAKREVRKGGGRGRRHPDHAVSILEDKLGWGVKRATDVVARLIKEGRAIVRTAWDPKHNKVDFLDIMELEKAEESGEDPF